LFPRLNDAAPDDVVDESWVDPRTLDQSIEHLRRKVGGVHAGKSAIALTNRRPYGLDNYGFRHDFLSLMTVTGVLAGCRDCAHRIGTSSPMMDTGCESIFSFLFRYCPVVKDARMKVGERHP
jgi:hypothetical protein